jgi:hypothetical protein
MNNKFERIKGARLTKIEGLVGHTLPVFEKSFESKVGMHLDKVGKEILGQTEPTPVGVDITHLQVEIKSKCTDSKSKSDWTIGTMTYQDIIDTPYIDSAFYKKLQALWVIQYSKSSQRVEQSAVYYFDLDEIQEKLMKGYEDCRALLTAYCDEQMKSIYLLKESRLFTFGNEVDEIKFERSHRFKPDVSNYVLELNAKSKTSFKFRIKDSEMRNLFKLAASIKNPLFEF